ncbi:MAG: glycosyltransferase, partial [Leptolyngbyaceae cyanobacterium SM2_5_2]|nr:glycosyltransferase [Leptolyngbyaceae cyanobacterium SM2_5_2]
MLGFSIATNPFHEQINLIMQWGQQRLSRVVCVANVHMLMEAHWNPAFARVLCGADMLTPDGMPLVWTLNLLRKSTHDRVAG